MNIGGSADVKKTKEESEQTTAFTGTQKEKLTLDQTAIAKIIEDVLGGAEGLATIFGGEQVAGVFDSSVTAQASGDLVANIIGELAKITGETVTTTESQEQIDARAKGTDVSAGASFSIGG